MNMQEFKIFKDQNNSNLKFDFSLKNLNWMNIGGSAKVFFKPENLKELISFLRWRQNIKNMFWEQDLIF